MDNVYHDVDTGEIVRAETFKDGRNGQGPLITMAIETGRLTTSSIGEVSWLRCGATKKILIVGDWVVYYPNTDQFTSHYQSSFDSRFTLLDENQRMTTMTDDEYKWALDKVRKTRIENNDLGWNEEYRRVLTLCGLKITNEEPNPLGVYIMAPIPTPDIDGNPITPEKDPYSWRMPAWIVPQDYEPYIQPKRKSKPMITPTMCIYHYPCIDGFTAAWVIHNKYPDSNIEFVPANHGDYPPCVANHHVVIVDFSYPKEVMLEIADKALSVVVLDHHKTAKENFEGLSHPKLEAIFDMDRSGAQLAWDYYNDEYDQPILVELVADRDLWKWELPHSRELNNVINVEDLDFNSWETMNNSMESATDKDWSNMIATGKALQRAKNKQIDQLLDMPRQYMVIGGHTVSVVNCPYFLASEVGEALSKDSYFAATYHDDMDSRKFSLRSNKDIPSTADVSEIAKMYGGGGHKNASGFRMPHGWTGDS